MTARTILAWPDPRLSQVCGSADPTDLADIEQLVGDMFQTMYEANGRGLAAPQIGEMIRVFVMDTGWKAGDMRPMVCINPRIIARSDSTGVMQEGCLSIPGVLADVVRPEAITLAYTDLAGLPQQHDLTGPEARCAQHELDHLDGKVHFDRLDPDTRASLERAYFSQQAAH